MTGYMTSTSLTTTLGVYATVAGDTFLGVITFGNTMGLGTDTTENRLIRYPGTGTVDWYGLGMNSYTLVYNVSGGSTYNFYSAGTQ